jgi:hypothetical protein
MNIKKQRQKILGLERRWPTRNCWFWLLTTLLGMCIVDMHRLYRNLINEAFLEVDILEFSDMICRKLTVRSSRQTERLASLRGETADDASILECITDKDGNNRFSVTDKQLSRGRNVGRSILKNYLHLPQISYRVQPDNIQVHGLKNSFVEKG